MAHFFARLIPPRPTFWRDHSDAEGAVMGEHFGYLQRLISQGSLVMAGPVLADGGFGLCVLEAEDHQAAEALMAADPSVLAGLNSFEVLPMRVSLLR